MGRLRTLRIVAALAVGVGAASLCAFGASRDFLLAAFEAVLRGLGINKPHLLLVPAVLIAAWVALDIAAVFVGFRVFDRRIARRDALRRRLLAEEGIDELGHTVPHDDPEDGA